MHTFKLLGDEEHIYFDISFDVLITATVLRPAQVLVSCEFVRSTSADRLRFSFTFHARFTAQMLTGTPIKMPGSSFKWLAHIAHPSKHSNKATISARPASQDAGLA